MARPVKPRKMRHYIYDERQGKVVLKAEIQAKEVDPATLSPEEQKLHREFMKRYGRKRKSA
jgi:DNA replication initiation complex subunit (GINS family)